MNNQKLIGILGGGQMARMSLLAATRMGIDVAILDKEVSSPAGMLTKNEYIGNVNNDETLTNFIKFCDVITLENEFIDNKRLRFIENLGKKVVPSSHTFSLIQDKLSQKTVLRKHSIEVPDFFEINQKADYETLKANLKLPFVIKARRMGYDGNGNYLVKEESDFRNGTEYLSYRYPELMAEKFIDFTKELAVIVLRTKKEFVMYPVVETVQRDNICHLVIIPAKLNKKILQDVKDICYETLNAIKGFGIFAFEMFLTKKNNVLVNEIVPRPHNSGHYSIDACVTSQFENHIRSIYSFPLGSTELINKHSVMVNILGKNNDLGKIKNYETICQDRDAHLHVYCQKETKVGRKMGHITLIGDDAEDLLKRAIHLEKIVLI